MLLFHLFFILKRKLDNFTAKPRRIVLPEGLILLSGFPKEIANELESYIVKFKQSTFIIPSGSILPEIKIQQKQQFKDKAIGLRQLNDRQYEVVIVGYNSETKEAAVEETKNAGDFKGHAISVFQQEVVKKGLV